MIYYVVVWYRLGYWCTIFTKLCFKFWSSPQHFIKIFLFGWRARAKLCLRARPPMVFQTLRTKCPPCPQDFWEHGRECPQNWVKDNRCKQNCLQARLSALFSDFWAKCPPRPQNSAGMGAGACRIIRAHHPWLGLFSRIRLYALPPGLLLLLSILGKMTACGNKMQSNLNLKNYTLKRENCVILQYWSPSSLRIMIVAID